MNGGIKVMSMRTMFTAYSVFILAIIAFYFYVGLANR